MVLANQRRAREGGNIFTFLFGAVAVVGIITATTMQLISGPIKTASRVNALNMAQAQMLAAGRIMILDAATAANSGDIDTDGYVEPREYTTQTGGITGGGSIPAAVGASRTDPWGTLYGYCVWDAGPVDNGKNDAGSGSTNRLNGANNTTDTVVAIISAGPNKTFQTVCNAFDGAGADGVVTTPPSDDIVMKYSYAEALAAAGGLWAIKAGVANTATIGKSLEVTDPANSNAITAKIDRTTGIGDFLGITTNAIAAKSTNMAMTGTFKYGSTSPIELYNTADQTTNYEKVSQLWSSNEFYIGNQSGGTGLARTIKLGNIGATNNISIAPTGNLFIASVNTNAGSPFQFTGTHTSTSGTINVLSITPTFNQSGNSSYTVLRVNATESSTGSGTKLLADFQLGGVSKASIAPDGTIKALSVVYTSDRNAKKNIRPLEDSLDKILRLQGVSYEWKDRSQGAARTIGLIAQDVKKVYPELVSGKDGHMGVNYAGLVAPLIEAVKELKAENDALKARVERLEKQSQSRQWNQ